MRLTLRLRDPGHRADDHRRRREDPDHFAPVGAERFEGRQEDADERGEGRRLDAGGHEPGDRRRRALVGVGRPHVERHRRHLEREADDQQSHARGTASASATSPAPPSALPMRSSRVLPVSP